jgi:hypothetical protein
LTAFKNFAGFHVDCRDECANFPHEDCFHHPHSRYEFSKNPVVLASNKKGKLIGVRPADFSGDISRFSGSVLAFSSLLLAVGYPYIP